MPTINVDELKNAIIDSVKARAKDFLDKNKDAKDFLIERAERLAKLAAQYALETDGSKRGVLKNDMEIVKQTMENDVSAVAVAAATASRDLFKSLLGTAMDMLIKALPTIVAAL